MEDMDRTVAFTKALMRWAKWVESDVDPYKTKVFFRGVSPAHYRGEEWNAPGVTNCSNEARPMTGSSYPGGEPLASRIVKDVLSSNTTSVHLLDITTLSQLRKDGHPSTHNGFKGMDPPGALLESPTHGTTSSTRSYFNKIRQGTAPTPPTTLLQTTCRK
ncbi:UNVERIFIED_CONTAM: protein trichome birefringence-like 37 [Sesamum radiatum]|uniref:Protein trichome birefringence-like 37 n=1 Tax=Sesamum radiatum TaxID=300843 RepID=A0AAW2VLU5_SESRA